MPPGAEAFILDRIRSGGPLTAAGFMDLALYHPDCGYYARAARRSGRAGDFFTSVDVGPLFGEAIARQIDEMWRELRNRGAPGLHLVEAGAGDGRLARDILDAARRHHPDLYAHLRVTLVERSAAAREAQPSVLAAHRAVAESDARLPAHVDGVILANELLDAMPAHLVVMTDAGLREIYVTEHDGRLTEMEGPVSSPEVPAQLARAGVTLQPGWRAAVSVAAMDWIRRAAGALDRGFLLLFDYGHDAAELYSEAHAGGTLTTYRAHGTDRASWLDSPGESDLTTHVDLTSIRLTAEAAGLVPLGAVDQTYFLLGLSIAGGLEEAGGTAAVKRRLQARTLLQPGGLGSTIKAIAFAKDVGRPRLAGLSSGRLT